MSLQFLKSALATKNVQAFLIMLRHSEGTSSADGYKYIFGSSPANNHRFNDFSKHPDIKVPYGATFSTAAGAYQILFNTWEQIRVKLALTDFSPESQDIACAEIISERDALQLVMYGKFNEALSLCGTIWASLPNNKYGQPMHPIGFYAQWYKDAGGIITD